MDNIFAEIEYEIPNTAPDKRLPPITPQAIAKIAIDPIREKFYAMRRLASDNPHTWKMPGFFYKQAKFMKDFTDDYPENIQFSMYYPCYQHMGYEQLRTYFTWRAKARHGEYPPTSSSYVFVYFYELLCGIGVSNPDHGLNMLIAAWKACREHTPTLDKYLPNWLKDYHIYYGLPDFQGFVNQHNLNRHYPELFLFDAENSLELWSSISNYKIAKSKFYSGDNAQLLKGCFQAVVDGIRAFCASRNTHIEDLFIYETRRQPWYPFAHALFYNWLVQPDRRVELLTETYYLQSSQWTVDTTIYHSGRAVLAGYIFKKTEACLRQAVNYKFKITAGHDEVNRSYQKLGLLGITLADLDQVIADAVARFQYERTRTVVTVSRDNLTRIREEALGTQERLIVPEEISDSTEHSRMLVPQSLPSHQYVETLKQDDFLYDFDTMHEVHQNHAISPPDDIWAALHDALTPTERTTLSLLLQDSPSTHANIKTLADENSIMLEVLADNINEKALDHVGDNILEIEETMTIYNEYKEKIAEMMG